MLGDSFPVLLVTAPGESTPGFRPWRGSLCTPQVSLWGVPHPCGRPGGSPRVCPSAQRGRCCPPGGLPDSGVIVAPKGGVSRWDGGQVSVGRRSPWTFRLHQGAPCARALHWSSLHRPHVTQRHWFPLPLVLCVSIALQSLWEGGWAEAGCVQCLIVCGPTRKH